MTAVAAGPAVVAAVVPPPVRARRGEPSAGPGPAGGLRRRPPPPLPGVAAARAGSVVYGMAAVDCRGRVADRVVLRALGWQPGTPLEFRHSAGRLLVRARPDGVFQVTGQGHLRLPTAVRHCCGLVSGDRVLLAADPVEGLLVVHPPAALDAVLAGCHGQLPNGGAA